MTQQNEKGEDTPAMRRIVIALLLVLVCLPVYMTAGHGTVHAAGCYGNSCDNRDPIDTGCANDATTVASVSIGTLGLLEMRYSAACNAVWTRTTSYIGTTYLSGVINRPNTSSRTGWGAPGFTQIYTGMLGDTGMMVARGCVKDPSTCQVLTI